MASYNKFQEFVENLALGKFNLGTDTLKVVLSNSAPVATYDELADITQIANGNGYTTGGSTAAITSCVHTTGTLKLILVDVVFTASGDMGPFQYVVLYSDTSTGDLLIGWWDYGSALTLHNGDTFTVDFDAGTGVLTIA